MVKRNTLGQEPNGTSEDEPVRVTAAISKSIGTPGYEKEDHLASSRNDVGDTARQRITLGRSSNNNGDKMYTTRYQNGGYGTGYDRDSGYQTSGYKAKTSGELVRTSSMTRAQEKEELQMINDKFLAYIQRVRMLREQSNQLNSSAFMKSSKILEEEVANLKTLYEMELENVR